MSKPVILKEASNLAEYFEIIQNFVSNIDIKKECIYFRGETNDYKENALKPSVYRDNFINYEEIIYREISRYNNIDFSEDQTTFDKLSRMQHYFAPTRLIDLSDDPLNALWFAKSKAEIEPCVYLIKITKNEIKYYDSDTVTVLSNLAKIGVKDTSNKCKKKIAKNTCDAIKNQKNIKEFNKNKSIKFLLHEIRNDINHFEPIINPRHISSVLCVKPKLTNSRIKSQKGAFLLFGLNLYDPLKAIPIIKMEKDDLVLNNDFIHKTPITEILKIKVKNIDFKILEKIGVIQPFIYPEMEKVTEYFKGKA